MTKRALIVSYLLLLAGYLYASSLTASAEGGPSSVRISWDGTDGAVYYDVYAGERFLARLDASSRSYTAGNLPSDTSFHFSVAARDGKNETLSSAFVTASTSSWDGIYEWENRTRRTNGGKVERIRMRVETVSDPEAGQYHNIYMIDESGQEVRVFPLFDFGDPDSGQWIDYGSDSPAAYAYRFENEHFNTSPFVPGRWRVDKVVIDYDSSSAYIQTSALGLVFSTKSCYELFIEDGVMKLSFLTEGSGIAGSVLFRNPNPGEGDAFILTRIE